MTTLLRWRAATSLPVEGDALRPDRLSGLDPPAIARVPIRVGNAPAEVGDLFAVERREDEGEDRLVLEGDLRHVHGLARGMAAGLLEIRGDVGDRLGEGMAGGSIALFGSAGHWAGADILDGVLHVRGPAGDRLGSALPGGRVGMRGGEILVEGTAGADVGVRMRRGLIAVTGAVGPGLGRALVAGTIVLGAAVVRSPGAGMKRGTIVLLGEDADDPDLLPTFRRAGRFRFPFLEIYARHLRSRGFPIPEGAASGRFDRYNGDLLEGGRGEVLVRAP